MGRIGIYGGSFDPPHIGHIHGAAAALQELGLERCIFMPAGNVPGKQKPAGGASPEQRKRMLEIAVGQDPAFPVSDWELRTPDSRTWETVLHVKDRYPGQQIQLILGSDLLRTVAGWKKSDILFANAEIAVLRRGYRGEDALIAEKKQQLEALGAKITVLAHVPDPISSTQLRRLLAFRCGSEFLCPGVEDYIRSQGLYNVNAHWKNLPMEQLEQVVISLLKPDRVRHVLGCRDTAVELARHWGADENDAGRAGMLHDVTKALDGPLQLTLCSAYGKILSDFSRKYPKTLHALTGSLVAERIFGENEAVVSAICHHTTGKADMNLLETIIYVADYMEPNRDFPGVERLRELAFTDIRAALKLGLEMTLEHLKNQGSEVSPESREALNWLNQ